MDEQALTTGLWVLGAVQVLSLITMAITIWQRLSRRPERREVSFAANAADRAEFEKHVADNAREHQELTRQVNKAREVMREEMKDDVSKLHEKVNKVDREVGEVKSSQNHQTAHLARMESKVDNITATLNRMASSSTP